MLSSGHRALDHRIFSKEALSLARRFAHVRVVGVHPRSEVIDGVEIRGLRPYRSRPERFLVHPLRCFLAARGRGPRVLILHDAELLPWAPLVRFFARWRVIYDAHEDFSNLVVRRRWLPSPLKPIFQRLGGLERRLAATCDGVMAVTQTLVDHFDNPRRVAIYNFPASSFFDAASAAVRRQGTRDIDVVHLGTLSEERLTFLVEVLRLLERRRPGTRTLLIGLRPDQIEIVEQALVGVDVEVHGSVPYERIPSMLARCSLGVNVHPILHPHLLCAVPVKVFEYMAAGCTVVTSALPELEHLFESGATEQVVTVREGRPERFAAEIDARLTTDDGLSAGTCERRIREVERTWSWSSEESKFLDFVCAVAGAAR